MLGALIEFFENLFGQGFTIQNGYSLYDFNITLFNVADLTLAEYLAIICALISLIFIVVLCCLFVYRLIKLVGRLFSGGTL